MALLRISAVDTKSKRRAKRGTKKLADPFGENLALKIKLVPFFHSVRLHKGLTAIIPQYTIKRVVHLYTYGTYLPNWQLVSRRAPTITNKPFPF